MSNNINPVKSISMINTRHRRNLTIQEVIGGILGLTVFGLALAASLIAGYYEYLMSAHVGSFIVALTWGLVLFIYWLSTYVCRLNLLTTVS